MIFLLNVCMYRKLTLELRVNYIYSSDRLGGGVDLLK